jgi:hypothetical protein
MLSPETQKDLKHEKKRSGENYVQMINLAIIKIGEELPSISDEIEVWYPG